MRFGSIGRIGYLSATLLLAGSLSASQKVCPPAEPAAASYSWDFPGEASALLKEIQVLGGKLNGDTETLEMFTRTNQVSWQNHATQLNQVREHINSMGELLCRLQTIRHVALPWQQQAIDRIQRLAVEMATRTQAAIEHLSENQNHLFAPSYKDHVTAISDRADEVSESVGNFLEFAETQQKLERLQEKLEGPAS